MTNAISFVYISAPPKVSTQEVEKLVLPLPEDDKPAEADKQIKIKLKKSFFNDNTNGKVLVRGILVADTEGYRKGG